MILVQPVGIGVGVENAFYVVLKKIKPDKILFVLTKEALGKISDLIAIAEADLERIDVETLTISSPDDPIRTFMEVWNRVKDIEEPLVVDITLGTKAMASALFLVAVKKRAKVTYVRGSRDPQTGKVRTGTEEVLVFDTQPLAGVG